MRRMYAECGLVHADLSKYNLLWYKGRVFVIDVSQSVEQCPWVPPERLLKHVQLLLQGRSTRRHDTTSVVQLHDWNEHPGSYRSGVHVGIHVGGNVQNKYHVHSHYSEKPARCKGNVFI